jgi:integrase
MALQEYQQHLADKGTKPVSYLETIRRLRLFFPSSDLAASLTTERCERYYDAFRTRKVIIGKDEQRREQPISVDYQRNTLAEARSFLKWCVTRRYLRHNPLDGVEGVGRRKQGKLQLTADEAKRFFDCAMEKVVAENEGALAATMALLMGLRASEITNRIIRDLDQGGAILRITNAKTRKGNRLVAVPDVLQPFLLQLVDGRSPFEPLFALDGQPHLPSWIRFHVRRLCLAAKVPVVCAHGLRGTHASLAEAAGTSSQVVAATLGHESVKTTHGHYTRPDAVANAQQGRVLAVIQGGRK